MPVSVVRLLIYYCLRLLEKTGCQTTSGYMNIHPLLHGLSARRCPMSLISSLGEFPGYWDLLWYPGLSPVLVSIAFPYVFHIWVFFHSLFFTCLCISFVYF